MDIAETIRAELRAVLRSHGVTAPAIAGGDALTTTLGLSSLEVLSLVPRLDAIVGVDAASERIAITEIRTVDDLIRLYARAREPVAGAPANPLEASAMRAARRRSRGGG